MFTGPLSKLSATRLSDLGGGGGLPKSKLSTLQPLKIKSVLLLLRLDQKIERGIVQNSNGLGVCCMPLLKATPMIPWVPELQRVKG